MRTNSQVSRRVAIIAFYEAYPPASGAASVSYNLAKFWSGDSLVVQVGSRDERLVTEDGVQVVTLAGATESRAERLVRLPGLVQRMTTEISREQTPIVVLEGASWAVYHWLLLQHLRRSLPQVRIVYHSHNVEYLLRDQRHHRAIAILTRWAEAQLVKHADLATAVSKVDQDHFARLYGVNPVLLPNGVDTARFGRPDSEGTARLKAAFQLDQYSLLFAGFYSYAPNREATDYLVGSIMPALRERHQSATLALTGGGAPYREPWLRNVGCIAYEDFAAFVASCGVAVAPIFSGSGTRLKILEAMAARIPVVATEKAAEGLELTHGKDVLFANTTDGFVSCIENLFDNPALAASLCERAAVTVARYSWQRIVDEFERVLYLDSFGYTPKAVAAPTAV